MRVYGNWATIQSITLSSTSSCYVRSTLGMCNLEDRGSFSPSLGDTVSPWTIRLLLFLIPHNTMLQKLYFIQAWQRALGLSSPIPPSLIGYKLYSRCRRPIILALIICAPTCSKCRDFMQGEASWKDQELLPSSKVHLIEGECHSGFEIIQRMFSHPL